jgi:hypothetical protein
MDLFKSSAGKDTDNVLLGIITGSGHNINGIGVSSISLTNTGYVRGVQVSGIYTTLGTELNGVQAAGIFNTAGGDVHGIQAAGIYNVSGGDVHGIQAAGIFNKAAGLVNGIQGAGIFNQASGKMRGIQAAGVYNYAGGGIQGIQAGLVNIAGGFSDNTPSSDGTNLVSTVQAGLVNISENEKTIPLGLVNIVKNGIFHPAVYYDDSNFLNFSLRSGSSRFYSLISIGTQLTGAEKDNLFVYRGGIGFELPLGKVFLDLDLSRGSILNMDTLGKAIDLALPGTDDTNVIRNYQRELNRIYNNATANLTELRLSVGFKIFEHLGVFAGISYGQLNRRSYEAPELISIFGGNVFVWNNELIEHKIGFFMGLQF